MLRACLRPEVLRYRNMTRVSGGTRDRGPPLPIAQLSLMQHYVADPFLLVCLNTGSVFSVRSNVVPHTDTNTSISSHRSARQFVVSSNKIAAGIECIKPASSSSMRDEKALPEEGCDAEEEGAWL